VLSVVPAPAARRSRRWRRRPRATSRRACDCRVAWLYSRVSRSLRKRRNTYTNVQRDVVPVHAPTGVFHGRGAEHLDGQGRAQRGHRLAPLAGPGGDEGAVWVGGWCKALGIRMPTSHRRHLPTHGPAYAMLSVVPPTTWQPGASPISRTKAAEAGPMGSPGWTTCI
jgi:hypothetical protein